MKNFKHLLIIIALLACNTALAQSIYSIKLHLTDEKTLEPVAFATASVTVKGEKTPLKYTLTDDKGDAVITKLKKGTYLLRAELMGYKTYTKEIVLEKNVDLGVIKMGEDAEVLDAAKVSDVGNPIVIKKDTVEYNASSFKTSDNDMLEQLLKKLPGIEVGTDGSITANGETIKKITIDGKTFFLDDPQLASKNIPAKIIEKVKVVEKKSDQAMFTGIDDGEEETIIDLKLRPGMAKGWFGNVMGGGGHDVPGAGSDMNDWRYQGAAMVGRFVDNSQISIILNANNTNNRGFNDVAGSMMGNMRGGRGGMGRGQGGFGGNNGISTTWMGGVNGAFTLCDGDMDLSGNYLYNGSDKDVIEETAKTTYLQNEDRFNNTYGVDNTFSQGHRFGVRLEHKFSENTSIIFEPQFNFGSGHYTQDEIFNTSSLAAGAKDTLNINSGRSNNTGVNNNWSTSGFLLLRQKLGKAGRTLSVNLRYNYSNNVLNGYNRSFTEVYAGTEQPDTVNQRFAQNTNNTSISGRIVYTEPLTKHLFLEANYHYSWNLNTSNKNVFTSGDYDVVDRLPVFNPVGEVLDEIYSNNIRNESHDHKAGVTLSYQLNKLRINLGAAVNPTITHNETNGKTYDNMVPNWSPQAMVFYDITDNTNLRLFYFGRSAQPSTNQLMPVPDNSDPLNIALGNPYLKPYFNHNIRARFGYTNKKTFTSVNANIRGTLIKDALTNAQWYDKAGVNYSIPVNGPTTTSMNANVFVNSPIAKSKFSIFSMTFLNYGESVSYVGTDKFANGSESNNGAVKYYNPDDATFNHEVFHTDYGDLTKHPDMFSVNKSQTLGFTQRLRFTYRNDFVEVSLGGRTRMNKSWYTLNKEVAPTWNNQADGSMNWTIPGGINLIAEAKYNWYNGYTTYQEDEIILNAEITKLLFKKKFTIALKAYDILGQSKNLSVTDASNNHIETRNNTLGRYIILSLTYRFGNFNQGGGQRRGPGGPGGPHGGPHGGFGGPPRR